MSTLRNDLQKFERVAAAAAALRAMAIRLEARVARIPGNAMGGGAVVAPSVGFGVVGTGGGTGTGTGTAVDKVDGSAVQGTR